MDIQEIQTLYAYNRWANRRLLKAARQVDWQDSTRDLRTSYGSVRGTLVHIVWGEWLWLRRWRGESPRRMFVPEDFPDWTTLESRWSAVESEQQAFLKCLTDELLEKCVSYENLQGERWEYSLAHMMQHLVNHSSYHRGQVVTLLRQLGQTPPTTDFLVFIDEGAPEASHTEKNVPLRQ
jgi:uncharacterized damage-inducible protein DinB